MQDRPAYNHFCYMQGSNLTNCKPNPDPNPQTLTITLFCCSGWSMGSVWLTLCCGGSIHSCPIVHSKLPMEANCPQLDHCCSVFHKAPFWGHCCTFCTLPNSNMWSQHGMRLHQYADDSQLYLHVTVSNTVVAMQCFAASVSNVNDWMRASRLRLNPARRK